MASRTNFHVHYVHMASIHLLFTAVSLNRVTGRAETRCLQGPRPCHAHRRANIQRQRFVCTHVLTWRQFQAANSPECLWTVGRTWRTLQTREEHANLAYKSLSSGHLLCISQLPETPCLSLFHLSSSSHPSHSLRDNLPHTIVPSLKMTTKHLTYIE